MAGVVPLEGSCGGGNTFTSRCMHYGHYDGAREIQLVALLSSSPYLKVQSFSGGLFFSSTIPLFHQDTLESAPPLIVQVERTYNIWLNEILVAWANTGQGLSQVSAMQYAYRD